jgi:hypothetical protein
VFEPSRRDLDAAARFTGIDFNTLGVYSMRNDWKRHACLGEELQDGSPLTHFLEMLMYQASGRGDFLFHAPQRLARFCLRTLAIAASGCVLTGCMTARIEELREAPTQIGSHEAIVLLAKPHLEGTGTEEKFMNCLERELVGQEFSAVVAYKQREGKEFDPRSSVTNRPFQIYADHHFVDALYPWLEPSTAPANAQGFSAFLARPGVSDRVNSMGVRFIVWIDGITQKTDGGGSIACAAGPGGAGCLGLGWWEKSSDYEATVWDLRDGISAGTLSTDVKGTSVMIGAIAPIPLIAPVQSTACNRLAGQLRSFLLGSGEDETAAVSRPQ